MNTPRTMSKDEKLKTKLEGKFPRFELLEGPTPIQHLKRLSNKLDGVDVYVKRDDLTGVGGGGNKLRKLEFLIGEAIKKNRDTIITIGARQSNHARLTAAAAARAGLKCELVLKRLVPLHNDDYIHNGNIVLDKILGAKIHDLHMDTDPMEYAEDLAEKLGNAYICPLGGSSPLGCLGYAACAKEIMEQADELNICFDEIVVANGSGGMHAGLVAGFAAIDRVKKPLVTAYTVFSRLKKAREGTLEIAQQTADLINQDLIITDADINIDDSQLGEGYGIPTNEMLDAVKELATTEGILLDPVYSGKAFAGLLHSVRNSKNCGVRKKVLFVMSGGLPGLFAYRSVF